MKRTGDQRLLVTLHQIAECRQIASSGRPDEFSVRAILSLAKGRRHQLRVGPVHDDSPRRERAST